MQELNMTKITLSLLTATLLLTSTYAEETLEDIEVISATQTRQKISSTTSNVAVITAQDIEERGFTSVAQALNSIAGISIVSNGGLGSSTSVYMRGASTNKILVLLDGVRYNDITSLSGADFGNLMISDIAQIEVVKGAQSGIWGADASAGVVNIISKSSTDGLNGSLYAEKGSFNTNKYGLNLSYKNALGYLKLSHAHIDTDGFSSYAPRGSDLTSLENDGYKNDTSSIYAGLNINENNNISLSHTIINAKIQADPFGSDGTYNIESKSKFSSVNFKHIDSFNELNLFAKRSIFSRFYPQAGAFGTANFDGEVQEYGLNSKIPYNAEDFVLLGADYKSFEHKNAIAKKFTSKALFISNTNTLSYIAGKTIITESLRYDQYDSFKNEFTGKIGIKHIYEKIEGLVSSINYGTGYNVPTLYHLYDPKSGNINLNPEKTSGYDISLAYKDFSLTYFKNTIDNLIQYESKYDNAGKWIGGNFSNVKGKSILKGIELAYQKELISDTLLSLSYSYVDAKDKDNKDLARRAKHLLKFGLDYYGIDKLHLGINGEYVGQRYDKADQKGQQTGKYAVLNFTASYDITKQIQVYGKIENLTDKYYQTVDGYATSPRAFYLGLKAKL